MKKILLLILLMAVAICADANIHIKNAAFTTISEKTYAINQNQVVEMTVLFRNNDTTGYSLAVNSIGNVAAVTKSITNGAFTLAQGEEKTARFQFGSNEIGTYNGYITYSITYSPSGQPVTVQNSFPISIGVGQSPSSTECSVSVVTDKASYGIGENMLITATTSGTSGDLKFLVYDSVGRLVSSQTTTPGSNRQTTASLHIESTLVDGEYQINTVYKINDCVSSDYDVVDVNTGIEAGQIPLKLTISAAYAPVAFQTCDTMNKSGFAYEVCVNGSMIQGQKIQLSNINSPASPSGTLNIGVSDLYYTQDQYRYCTDTVDRMSKNIDLLSNATSGQLYRTSTFWANESLKCKDKQIPEARGAGFSDGFAQGGVIGFIIAFVLIVMFAKFLSERKAMQKLNE